ncbi:MAG: nicotinamide riboside transporter PnuC [Crocinitomicaceae bacterium]
MDLSILLLEWVAAVFGAVYLYLVAKKNKWAWLFGGMSSFLFIFVFYRAQLPAQAFLSLAYVILSIYAFWSWNREGEIAIVTWKIRKHIFALQMILIIGGVIAWMKLPTMHTFEEKETFLLDLFIALFSLFATILGVLKEKSNWIYWIFINLACILLYANAALYATVLLYGAYFVLGIYGLREWNKNNQA